MPYEAFANVMSQLGGEYARTARERQLHERDRAERQADLADARAYKEKEDDKQLAEQITQAEKLAAVNTKAEVARLSALDDATLQREALDFGVSRVGIDGQPRPRAEVVSEIAQKKIQQSVSAAAQQAAGALKTRGDLAAQANNVEAVEHDPQIKALKQQYAGVKQQYDSAAATAAALQSTNPQQEVQQDLLARVNQVLPVGPSRAAFLKKNGLTEAAVAASPAQVLAIIDPMNPIDPNKLVAQKDAEIRYKSVAINQQLRLLEQSMLQMQSDAVKFGVTFDTPQVAAPPSSTSVGPVKPADKTNPFSAPPPVAPPDTDNYGGILGYFQQHPVTSIPANLVNSGGQLVGKAVNAGATVLGGPKLAQQANSFFSAPDRAVASGANSAYNSAMNWMSPQAAPSPLPTPEAVQSAAGSQPYDPALQQYFNPSKSAVAPMDISTWAKTNPYWSSP